MITTEQKANMIESIMGEMLNTFCKKNTDYGDSFSKSLQEYGITAALVRIEDKFNRIKRLAKNKGMVVDETIEDTLLDMANYCIMTVMEIRMQEDKK